MREGGLTLADRLIEENLESSLGQLARLVGQPSVSSQNVGMKECAELTASLLEEHGFSVRLLPTPTYPVVFAESPGATNRTLLCYNHYDVQPAEPLELWNSPPFKLTERDGKLYGRGAADDKGHVISRLAALQAVRVAHGELPCRVKFVIEGGEEISSPHIPEFVQEHQELLAADACIWESGGVDYDGRPSLILGMRGILYVQLNARSMSRDAHSGSAHLLPNAAWRLVRALSTLKDEDERVLIPGFYEGARPPNEHDLSLLEQLDMHETEQKESYGIESFVLGRTGLGAATAVYSPTANIAGLSAGYEGPGPKTVIPSKAMAKIDFRLIPDQDPQEILEKLKSYMHDAGFDDIEVEALGGERAATTPPDDPFVRMTGQTALEIYGKPARIQPLIGGSGPMHPFREFLDLPVVTVGIGNPENLIHAPNENIRTRDFVLGTRHMARLVERWTEIG